MIIVDTLRADHLSTYGYDRETSPNITEFAARGVLFRNAISAASWTLPSHASIVTGKLPHEHEADRPDRYLDGRFPTVAEAFSHRGYHTAAFSANWWLFARRLGFGRGFMHFQDFNSVSSAVLQTNLGTRIRNAILKVHPAWAPLGRSDASSINRDILHWIDRNPGPFFIMANYMDVHEPYTPPLPCFHQFSKLDKPSGQIFLGNPRKNELTPAEVQNELDAYDASIRCMDTDFASLVNGLKQRGLMNNTVVVLTSDHGEEFNEHGLMSHESTLYREVVHVPLIVVGPGIPAGTTVDRPVSQVNLPATLLALSGGDGTSFGGMPLNLAWSKSQDVLWPDPVSELAQLPTDPKAPNYYTALQSIVTPEWQMIVGGKKGRELYRWRDDRLEVHDLASAAGNESIASRLVDALQCAERGELAASASADSEDEKANPVTPRKKAPVRDKNADRERNNEYLKALGYIPN
jgi:arylsulfatase A-like enzyme